MILTENQHKTFLNYCHKKHSCSVCNFRNLCTRIYRDKTPDFYLSYNDYLKSKGVK